MPQSGGKATFLHILGRIATGRVSCKFDKSASALEIYEQVTNFDVFNELLVQKKTSLISTKHSHQCQGS